MNQTTLVALAFMVAAGLFASQEAASCSAFCLAGKDKVVVAKSYDWFFGYGHGALYTNPRGISRSALVLDSSPQPASWVSKYGSVTFTQFGKGFPIGGMNERGLVVEMLQLYDTEYNESEVSKPFVNEAQWTQYQLDNFASVEELVANIDQLRVVGAYTGIHYFIADKTGAAAAVEFLDGKALVFHRGSLPYAALTNDSYESAVEQLIANRDFEAPKLLRKRLSEVRFQTAARVSLAAKSADTHDLSALAWKGLDDVRLNGFAPDALFEPSQWNLVYDVTLGTISFRTRKASSVKTIQLKDVELSAGAREKVLNMNLSEAGDVAGRLVDYTAAFNTELIEKNRWLISKNKRSAAIEHALTETCKASISR